jgi:hypothetical protein
MNEDCTDLSLVRESFYPAAADLHKIRQDCIKNITFQSYLLIMIDPHLYQQADLLSQEHKNCTWL